MSQAQTPAILEREITIYATRGGQMQKIMTSARTWGELQPLVRQAGFDLSSLLAAENINKSDLVNDLAVLPSSPFRLFLRPKQTKSGAYSRKECFTIVKKFLLDNPGKKSLFTIDGKNVTQLKTEVLQALVAKHCKNINLSSEEVVKEKRTIKKVSTKKVSTKSVSTKSVLAEPAEYENEVIEDKENNVTEPSVSLDPVEKVSQAIELISEFSDLTSYNKSVKHLSRLLEEVLAKEVESVESEEEAIAREAKEMGY